MAKPPTIFKRCTNLLLQHIAAKQVIGQALPTEQRMTELCQGSRTAIRSVLAYLHAQGLISDLKERRLLRMPRAADYFDEAELQTGADRIQRVLMERIYQSDLPPGAEFSEAELARASGASTISVREFLIGFSRFGLIEKKPRCGWRLCAFDMPFATEVANMRQMFEFAAVEHFNTLPAGDPAFAELDKLIERHEQLASVMPARHKDFPALDRDVHTFLIGLLKNRFAQEFYNIVSLVFHYHYQWDKGQEAERIQYALQEHLVLMHALARRDPDAALAAMRTHLNSARSTMMQSIRTREKTMHSG